MTGPGWYTDPWRLSELRWWDGSGWTAHVHTAAPQSRTEVVPVATRAATPSSNSRPLREDRTVPALRDVLAQLRPHPALLELDEQIEVAGETYHVKGIKGVYKAAGMPISDRGSTIDIVPCALLPEPWNPHDANAVAVMIGHFHVGYLPAEDARSYAAALGFLAGKGYLITGTARVWAKSDSGVIRARVTILIPEPDVLRDLS